MGMGPWPDLNCTPLMDDELFPVIHHSLYKAHYRKKPTHIFSDSLLIHDRDPAAGLVRGTLAIDELTSGALVRPFGSQSIRITDAYWIVTSNAQEPRAEVTKVVSWMLKH
jgi:LysR family glycine cleavage system transcriptional activator